MIYIMKITFDLQIGVSPGKCFFKITFVFLFSAKNP